MKRNLADELAQTQFRVHDPEAIIEHHHGNEVRVGKESTQVWRPGADGRNELWMESFDEGHKARAIRAIEALINFHGTLE